MFFYTATTARKVSRYGIFSGPYFPAFGLNTGKYGPEKTPYLDTFRAVALFLSFRVLTIINLGYMGKCCIIQVSLLATSFT